METYHIVGIAFIIGFALLCMWLNILKAEYPEIAWRNFCEDVKELLSSAKDFFVVAITYILVCGGLVLFGIYACYKDPIGLYEENGFMAFYWYIGIGVAVVALLKCLLERLFEPVMVARRYKKRKDLAYENYKSYAHVINLLSYLRSVKRERYEAMNAFRFKEQKYLNYKPIRNA